MMFTRWIARLQNLFFCIGIASVILSSCTKESEDPDYISLINEDMYALMKVWYLWYNEIPKVNPDNYSTPQALLEALRNPKDKWSVVMTWEQYSSYFEAGDYVGHGVSFMGDEQGNLVVAFLFNNSPLIAEGVTRGWKVKSINGTTISPGVDLSNIFGADLQGVENTFVFEDLQGTLHTITTAKKIIDINTVLETSVLDTLGKKIGYLAFESFIGPSNKELDTAFSFFNSKGINELVIDLRYNGGGQMDVALHLAGLITSAKNGGKIFTKIQHNTKVSYRDTAVYIPQGMVSPNIDRIFFIASRGTASASEAMINGLSPWMDVQVVGDSTYGKPVGMYVVDYSTYGYMFLPVSFKLSNANDFGDYFTGLPANAYVPDDLYHLLGSPEESCMGAVLHYISTGSYPLARKSLVRKADFGMSKLTGIKAQNPIF